MAKKKSRFLKYQRYALNKYGKALKKIGKGLGGAVIYMHEVNMEAENQSIDAERKALRLKREMNKRYKNY